MNILYTIPPFVPAGTPLGAHAFARAVIDAWATQHTDSILDFAAMYCMGGEL